MEGTKSTDGGYRFSVVVGKNGKGWAVICPEFGDSEASSESYKETLANIGDAILVRIEDISRKETVNFTMFQVSI